MGNTGCRFAEQGGSIVRILLARGEQRRRGDFGQAVFEVVLIFGLDGDDYVIRVLGRGQSHQRCE